MGLFRATWAVALMAGLARVIAMISGPTPAASPMVMASTGRAEAGVDVFMDPPIL